MGLGCAIQSSEEMSYAEAEQVLRSVGRHAACQCGDASIAHGLSSRHAIQGCSFAEFVNRDQVVLIDVLIWGCLVIESLKARD